MSSSFGSTFEYASIIMASTVRCQMTKKAPGSYASVNGLKMYYEIHGAGEPLVLLHGGVGGIEMFAPVLPELAKSRQLIGVDLQGHAPPPTLIAPCATS